MERTPPLPKEGSLYHRIMSVRASAPPPPNALEETIYAPQSTPIPFLDTPQFKTTLALLRELVGEQAEIVTFSDLSTLLNALEIDTMVQQAKLEQLEDFVQLKISFDTAKKFFDNPDNYDKDTIV